MSCWPLGTLFNAKLMYHMFLSLVIIVWCILQKVYCALQDLYAVSQQVAAGTHGILETALAQGRAVAASAESLGEAEEELSVEKLSNAALVASSVLSTHGAAEVTKLLEGCLDRCYDRVELP